MKVELTMDPELLQRAMNAEAEVAMLRVAHDEEHDRAERHAATLRGMTQWLEKNQPDVFKRGLWDAIAVARDGHRCADLKTPNVGGEPQTTAAQT